MTSIIDLLMAESGIGRLTNRATQDSSFVGEMFVSMLAKLLANGTLTVDDGLDIMFAPISGNPMAERLRDVMRPDIEKMKEIQQKKDKELQEKRNAKSTTGA